jgi:hypothetical protein
LQCDGALSLAGIAVKVKCTLVFFDGRTDEMFKAREKDRAVRAVSNSVILKNIEILATEDHR